MPIGADRPSKDPRYNQGSPALDAFRNYKPSGYGNIRAKAAANPHRGFLLKAAGANPRKGYLRTLAAKKGGKRGYLLAKAKARKK